MSAHLWFGFLIFRIGTKHWLAENALDTRRKLVVAYERAQILDTVERNAIAIVFNTIRNIETHISNFCSS